MAYPPGKAFDPALRLGAVGDFRRDVGQLRTLTPDDAADHRGEGRQVPHNRAGGLARIILYQGGSYGTITTEVVTHRRLLTHLVALTRSSIRWDSLLNTHFRMG